MVGKERKVEGMKGMKSEGDGMGCQRKGWRKEMEAMKAMR